jgi:hypothetical protein
MTLHQYFLTFDTLNKTQWHLSCTLLDSIINNISFTIQKTCSATSIIPLIHTTAQQGGCLPCKIQKLWKTHLSTYHLIHKAIYITQHNPKLTQSQIYSYSNTCTPADLPRMANSHLILAKTAKINA